MLDNFLRDIPPPFRISEALNDLARINSNELHDLQGNLKDLSKVNYRKLAGSISRYGFMVPLFIWFEPGTGRAYTLDGNQRLRFIRTAYPSGVMLPYIEIEARDRTEAKEKILVISSQYGETTKDGFDEFLADMPRGESFVRELTTFNSFLDIELRQEQEEQSQPDTYGLKITCATPQEQHALFDRLVLDGYTCTLL